MADPEVKLPEAMQANDQLPAGVRKSRQPKATYQAMVSMYTTRSISPPSRAGARGVPGVKTQNSIAVSTKVNRQAASE